MEPCSAAASGMDFPYRSPTICYIEIRQDGKVTQGADGGTCERARSGESRLLPFGQASGGAPFLSSTISTSMPVLSFLMEDQGWMRSIGTSAAARK